MSDHTPGPWEQNGISIIKFGEGGRAIALLAYSRSDNTGNVEPAKLDDPNWDTNMANANLLAAAPELLQTLKELLNEYSSILDNEFSMPDDLHPSINDSFVVSAKDIIAKAEGKQQ